MNNSKEKSPFPSIRSPPKQEAVSQSVLSGLFSKQFLHNVKNQLSTKSRSSKHLPPNIPTRPPQINRDKIEIVNLATKIRELAKQNQQLRQKLKKLYSSKQKNVENQFQLSNHNNNKRDSLRISSQVQINIQAEQQIKKQQQIEKLKEKIQNLEMYKTVREQRFSQLLEKEARYQSQIRLLMVKEIGLEQQVKNLRETIKIQVLDMDGKPLRMTKQSEDDFKISNYDLKNSKNGVRLPFNNEQLDSFLNFLMKNNSQNGLLVSQCRNIDVPDNYQLHKMSMKKSESLLVDFNQMDNLIAQELPFLKASDDDFNPNRIYSNGANISHKLQGIGINNNSKGLQQSIVIIDVNHPAINGSNNLLGEKKLDQKKSNINQSTVEINLNCL